MSKPVSKRFALAPLLSLVIAISAPFSAYSQGSIFGAVTNSDLSTPANGDISFFGFLDDTDEEIRIESSTGAGYDAGNWYDDFQNFLTEASGNPYDYYFYNPSRSEGFHLARIIPDNSFQQEDIALVPVSGAVQPTGLTFTASGTPSISISWNNAPGQTVHVYRRPTSSSGSFFRIDDPEGFLSDPGVADSSYVDFDVDGVSSYQYVLIAEDASGNYSPHSEVLTADFSDVPCCIGIAGDINGDGSDADPIDLAWLVDNLFSGGPDPICWEEGDLNADGSSADPIDLSWMVESLFNGGPLPEPCL